MNKTDRDTPIPSPTDSGVQRGPALRFDLEVPSRGYAWWYVDALSDDGKHGLTLIAFIGSVFSPYYFKGRRRGLDDPRDYCSLNVCLYGEERRWTMTERRAGSLSQSTSALGIGPSGLRWNKDDTLSIDIDELGTPIPQRVRGRVHLTPLCINRQSFSLHDNGRHHWRPVSPSARVEVQLERPKLSWTGHAYFDSNWGQEPIEDGFVYWDWSRASMGDESAILYNMQRRDAQPLALALRFAADGTLHKFDPPPNHRLPRTPIWRVARGSQADDGHPPSVVKTLEDTPFYSRSVIETHLLGRPLTAVHESLSLERFRSPIVQYMLPYRMPRRRR
ncbi:MAG: carotenoid 1,2-hydratase [Thiohalocapsa sp.]